MIVNNILLLQFILLSQHMNIGVQGVPSPSELKYPPIITGTQCTSRTLRPEDGGSTMPPSLGIKDSNSNSNSNSNSTDDYIILDNDHEWDVTVTPPYCPNGYVCDVSSQHNEDGTDTISGLCVPCSGSSDRCFDDFSLISTSGPVSIETTTESLTYSLERAFVEECQAQCGAEKNMCSSTEACPNGLFCNFEGADDANGYCEECPYHLYFCADKNLTSKGVDACTSSCGVVCKVKAALTTSSSPISIHYADAISGSPQLSATGPIIDCGLGLEPCESAKGSICFIERGKAPFLNKTRNCYAGGGIATVIYNVEASCENIEATFGDAETLIPSVTLTHLEGKAILKEAIEMPLESPLLATIVVGGHGISPEYCIVGCTEENKCEGKDLECNFDNGEFGDCVVTKDLGAYCNNGASFISEHLQCQGDGEFCDFSLGKRGRCSPCPEIDSACFFSDLNKEGAKECAAVCTESNTQELESAPCKFCPKGSFDIGDIGDGFTSTENEEVTTPCEFCATTSASTCSNINRWDMEHPHRTIRMFGSGVECWAVAEFYRSLNIEADSDVCESARSFNYICGCSDTLGYAGANTKTKQVALAWLPRVGAILSILGSTLMIIGVLQDEYKRKRVIGELIIALSCFDIIGSIGYAFTTYPTPEEDHIYGGEGNEASCKAQGFFIQIGTISLYLNVSIAFYYLLIIQYSWRENRLRKSWVYRMLFVVPISVGSVFAFAGIPFYDNAILWCNNSRKYWSEIPVIIGIAIATVIMINLCWFVFKSERASRRFRRHSQNERHSLSKAFFMQSMVYLGAFYLTWPPYLALQIMISRGYAFSYYGFYMFAGTAVTLQGFWNFTFHTGLKTRAIESRIKAVWSSVLSVRAGSRIFRASGSMMVPKSQESGNEPVANST